MKTILVAGGGTGGHVFPGLAIADLLRLLANVNVVFAGSPRGLESKLVPKHGYDLELLDVEPIKGGGVQGAVRGALVAAQAMRRAAGIVTRLRPSAVLSVGGYAAGPAALACVRKGVPLAILEPNSVLGLTNRLLAPFAKRAYVAWPSTARVFRHDKARLYGVPLRSGFVARSYAVKAGKRKVLVLGGSQGARALNERLPVALGRAMAELGPFEVFHQTGADHEASVRSAYEAAGVKGATVVPFIDDVAARMADADVIVARAGAVTLAEIATIGRASLLVPFPHAADDHQAKNALGLAELGGAVCIRQEAADEARIASELVSLLADDARRVRMANVAREHGKPHAAEDIARDLLSLANVSLRERHPKEHGKNGSTNGSNGHISIPKGMS